MPASPSFPSGKWRKRKREPQSRRQKHEDEAAADEDEEHENNDDLDDESEDPHHNPNSTAAADPNHRETEVLSESVVRICDFPTVVRHAVNRPHSSVLAIAALERANQYGECKGHSVVDLENVSYGQLQTVSAMPAESAGGDHERADGGNSVACVLFPPTIMEGRGVVKRFGNRVHIVPVHSDWFSPATVHRLERQVVPQFFSGKAPEDTPEKYMECRNYIVAKYMENPDKRLTISDCQGLIVGIETEDLSRIVRFLDHWGIINYCAAAPNRESWNGGSYLREEPTGEIQVPSAALKSIDSLIKFDKPKCRLKAADVYASLSCPDDDLSDLDNRIRERLSENRCNYCSQPLPIVYYQSQKEVDILLCSNCFHEGRFVSNHSSIDFIKFDSTKDYGDLDGESWTDQETLRLLEAVEIYKENWNEITDHVGSKSKAQCILHFLRLPMEDGLLESIEVPGMSMSSNASNRDDRGRLHSNYNGDSSGSHLQYADSDSRLPFENSRNPVMALVAFLASAVGPRVAAACAHASLAVLCEDSRMNSENTHGRDSGLQGDIANSIQQKEGNLAIHGSSGRNEAEVAPLSKERVKAAANAGLAAAATKAKLFADHEEREIQRLSANIINHQLKRLELKLKQFAEVETLLMKECEQLERARQRFAAERTRIISTRFGPAGVTPAVSLPGVALAMVNNNTVNNRQQVISASPSQPSSSGYGNNQSINPNMPFMPRQQMFGLGQRLPLGAIQPSSSVPSPKVMFNSPGNSQSTHSHPMLKPVSGTGSGLG